MIDGAERYFHLFASMSESQGGMVWRSEGYIYLCLSLSFYFIIFVFFTILPFGESLVRLALFFPGHVQSLS